MAGVIGIPEPVSSENIPPGIDQVGTGCRISDTVSVYTDISHSERGRIVLGDEVILLDHVRLVTGDTRTNKEAFIHMGSRIIVNVGCYLSGEGGLRIEDEVLIGPGAKLLSAGHEYDNKPVSIYRHSLTYGTVTVEKGAWIGAGAIILEGVSVGKGAVVGAASVVTKNVPAFSVVAGNPARVIKWREGFRPKTPVFLRLLKRIKRVIRGLGS